MAKPNSKNWKKTVFSTVARELEPAGFVLDAGKERFAKRHDGLVDVYQLVCVDEKPGWRIRPNVAVRVDLLEDIFHRASGFEGRYQADTISIGGVVGSILHGSARACEFVVQSEASVVPVAAEIVNVFRQAAIPYFAKYEQLREIDIELNDRPTERTQHRVAPWLRCSTGLIVARLVGRSDYRSLLSIYEDVMRRVDNGFYLPRFEALARQLESQAIGGNLGAAVSTSDT